MKTLKLFSIIAFIGLMVWSLCVCAAPTTQLPTLPLEASATPTAIATAAKPSPAPTRAAKPTTVKTRLTAAERAALFEDVWSTINMTYFDPKFGGLDWNAVHTKYEPLINATGDEEDALPASQPDALGVASLPRCRGTSRPVALHRAGCLGRRVKSVSMCGCLIARR